jgi:hypothetical protein
MTPVGENLQRIRERIGNALARSGRRAGSVRLIGVTKRVDPERILEAAGAGLTEIGESKVQEAESKAEALGDTGLTWHLIGHLQSNKAVRAVSLFSCIQSVDSVALAGRLDRLAPAPLDVMVQVRLGDEAGKSGVEESELAEVVAAVGGLPHLRLVGLMSVPPFAEDPEQSRPYFRLLRESAGRLGLAEVSMGMSHDFEVAIEEGATMIRVGTALFGARS